MTRRLLLLASLIALAVPVVAQAAEPPNQNDPCSRGGKNTCSTNGTGKYDTYRYGIRWFGDYRNAIPGVKGATFCIDLRFWYPAKRFRYEKRTTDGLKNREGQTVDQAALRRMSYAAWNYGRSQDTNRQAAVMLYVHGQMGDGAPGEASPAAAGPGVEAVVRRIERNAARYAGPYTVRAEAPAKLKVGQSGRLKVRVLSSTGVAVPDVKVKLTATGTDKIPASISTGSKGTASIPFTASSTKGVDVKAVAENLAAAAPDLYVPTRGAAARSGQRLIAPASASVQDTVRTGVTRVAPDVRTKATPDVIKLGEQSRDQVTIGGPPRDWRAAVEVRMYGPFRTRESVVCTGAPLTTVTYNAARGTYLTPPITPPRVGYYGYQLSIPASGDVEGVTTACPDPAEIVKVETQPKVLTQVSESVVTPGASITDKVEVSDLAGEAVTVDANLYGPFPARDQINCTSTPAWTGSFPADKDGTYLTAPVKLTVPGYYTYRETIAAGPFTRPADHPCGEVSETTIVKGKPAIKTQISAQQTAPGAQVTDKAVVTGLGKLSATVNVELWGPFEKQSDIRCEGTPLHTSTFVANGDGEYTTAPVTLPQAGYYTYRESIAPSEAYDGVLTECGEAAETTITKATPRVTTVVSDAVVRPGSEIYDTIKVRGLGKTPATIEVELYGPFRSRAEIKCTGTPYWKGKVDVQGDGEVRSPSVKVNRAGFYTYREKIAATPLSSAETTRCGIEAETSLARPLILTGKGDRSGRNVKVAAVRQGVTHIESRALGIDTAVRPVIIDMKTGALDVPKDISKAGWWRDGAAPGDKTGTTLIGGHVDSAKRGAGAFYPLRRARQGQRITIRTADGKERTYRVTGRRAMEKEQLPDEIFTRRGARRLVLVTCGGPFNRATGHYRDNIVITAVPV